MNSLNFNALISIILGVITTLLVPRTTCYPKGAPLSACDTGLPEHMANGVMIQPQKTSPPYRISVDAPEFRAGDALTVTIDSDQGVPFRGFFMQVRPLRGDSNEEEFRDKPLGRFFRINDKNSQSITCDVVMETQTHSDRFAKHKLVIKWKSPLLIRNDIVVRATLLANYSTFWANVESPRIRIIHEESLPVDGLEKPWLRELVKTVTAQGDENATRELVRARFEKGWQNMVEPHGYIMVHYVTDILPYEDSYPDWDPPNATAALPSLNAGPETAPLTAVSQNSTSAGNGTESSSNEKTTDMGHSNRLHYEALVKTLLSGDKSAIDELNGLLDASE